MTRLATHVERLHAGLAGGASRAVDSTTIVMARRNQVVILGIVVLTVVLTFLAVRLPLAAGGSAMDAALAAFAAAEAAPIERVRLFVEKDGVADVYYIDRVRPGRFRLVKNPRQRGPELIVVDGMQWVRTAAGWRKSPVRAAAPLVPSVADLLRRGLTNAVEKSGPDGGRTVEGDVAWTNGTACKGRLFLRIDSSGLPSLLRFEGACDGKPSHFRQAFSYTGPVTIAPPA